MKRKFPIPSLDGGQFIYRTLIGSGVLLLLLSWLAPVCRGSDAAASRQGGRLVVALRAEPATFNPIHAGDTASRTILDRVMADLIHLDRRTLESEPSLARAWRVSEDGLIFTLELRRDVRFSDGEPFDADDVLFTFRVNSDDKVASRFHPQLHPGGKAIRVRKLGSHRVEFQLEEPFAAGVKLFDSLVILPEHRLARAYEEERLDSTWGVSAPAADIVGLGPFRIRRYLPGQRLELERNPHYWKVDDNGQNLPYLDEIIVLFVPSMEAQVARFQQGEIDIIERLDAASFHRLEGRKNKSFNLLDLGPGFVFHFLFFNLNDIDAKTLPEVARKQPWFRDSMFRRAVSLALDRQSMVRLVYERRAKILTSPVTADRGWLNTRLEPPRHSLAEARRWLDEAGYTRDEQGNLHDARGQRVSFSLATNSSNAARVAMATIIQEDLRRIGIEVRVVTLDMPSLVDRVTNTLDFEAGILGLTDGIDPIEAINIWSSDGDRRLWRTHRLTEEPPWQQEIDQLLLDQMTVLDPTERKRSYDRVQAILAEEQPCVLLVSPNVLVGADRRLGHFAPATYEHVTLWNAEQLYWLKDNPGSEP